MRPSTLLGIPGYRELEGELSKNQIDTRQGANDFLIIEDSAAEEAQRLYAADVELAGSRPSLSALAGLAALQVVASDPMTREVLELVPSSRVLLIGTDGEPVHAAPAAQSSQSRAPRTAAKSGVARGARKRRRTA